MDQNLRNVSKTSLILRHEENSLNKKATVILEGVVNSIYLKKTNQKTCSASFLTSCVLAAVMMDLCRVSEHLGQDSGVEQKINKS